MEVAVALRHEVALLQNNDRAAGGVEVREVSLLGLCVELEGGEGLEGATKKRSEREE